MFKHKMQGLLCIALATILFSSGCGTRSVGTVTKDLGGAEQTNYPIKTDVTLKYWLKNTTPVDNITEASNLPWYKTWKEKTGVKIEFVHPALGQESQQFSILIASGELPDMIEHTWLWYTGGPDKAIDEKYIVNIGDYMDYAPNYKAFLGENPEIDKMVKTDRGNYYGFPTVQDPGYDDKTLPLSGLIMRKDWLDELGLKVPQTIDELHDVLIAFKNQKGAEAPLCVNADYLGRSLSGAFGTTTGWYQVDGKVKYGILESGYRDFLTTVAAWYKEGLLDSNIASLDTKMTNYAITAGKSGAAFGFVGSGIGAWIQTGKTKEPKYDLVGIPYPVNNVGERTINSDYGYNVGTYSVAVSEDSPYKELAVRLLDYAYSEEGILYYNFGQEGVSYNMENGYPKYTDNILKNDRGLTVAQALSLYCKFTTSVQDHRYLEQYYNLPQQQDAMVTWANVDTPKYQMPRITLNADESAEFSKIMGDVSTYVNEQYIKILLGKDSVSKYDEMISTITGLGIDKAITIQQAALDRYNKK